MTDKKHEDAVKAALAEQIKIRVDEGKKIDDERKALEDAAEKDRKERDRAEGTK